MSVRNSENCCWQIGHSLDMDDVDRGLAGEPWRNRIKVKRRLSLYDHILMFSRRKGLRVAKNLIRIGQRAWDGSCKTIVLTIIDRNYRCVYSIWAAKGSLGGIRRECSAVDKGKGGASRSPSGLPDIEEGPGIVATFGAYWLTSERYNRYRSREHTWQLCRHCCAWSGHRILTCYLASMCDVGIPSK